jgi:uncharacterized protein (TIGR03086 family)
MSTAMDERKLYRLCADEFAARVRRIGDRWDAPTPCAGWDVRALVRHVVEEELWAPPLLAGATIADVGDRFDGDQLGDDPLGAFEQAHAAALIAVDEAPDRDVHLSFGDTPAPSTGQLAADHLVHAGPGPRIGRGRHAGHRGRRGRPGVVQGRWRPTGARA